MQSGVVKSRSSNGRPYSIQKTCGDRMIEKDAIERGPEGLRDLPVKYVLTFEEIFEWLASDEAPSCTYWQVIKEAGEDDEELRIKIFARREDHKMRSEVVLRAYDNEEDGIEINNYEDVYTDFSMEEFFRELWCNSKVIESPKEVSLF